MAPIARPENVLKRAEELVAVGQSNAALQLLHELITSKRSKSAPIASLEPIMLRLIELSVVLRKGKIVKEGLYQYKNIAQNTSVITLEVVVGRFIELSEAKFAEAQAQAEKISLDAIEDLEAIETPESILLSTVSGDVSRDRTDRTVVTPWLKFLWETYRIVLDILRNNGRLEVAYQKASHAAFEFCTKYSRKTEFRRLCDLLRNHLQNAAKYSNQTHGINLSDPDTLQRHLDTRFIQLNSAVALELWQEAFRSVEDIHNLLTVSKRLPKPAVMANYYEKLSKIFLVSENYLFHAAAFNKYATLVRTQNKGATETELERLGSLALLSALAIPVIGNAKSKGQNLDFDENKSKNARLATLLNLSRPPTRAGLLKEALNKHAASRIKTEVRELFNILETQFHPLSICKKITPLIETLSQKSETTEYIRPLQQVILTRMFQQLSQVYENVSLDFVVNLVSFAEPFQIDAISIEKFIMDGCKKDELSIRIDHANNTITFDSDIFSTPKAIAENNVRLQATPSELVRTQLTRLAKCLYSTLSHVDPAFRAEREALKNKAVGSASADMEQEHQDTLARRAVIERRKELVQTLQMKKDQEEASRKAAAHQREAEAESKRLADESRRRELDRVKRDQEKIKADESRKLVEELKASGGLGKVDDQDLEGLDTTRLRAMQLEQLEKSSKDLNERMRITAKRIDHLERAYRRAEMPLVQKDADEQSAADRANFSQRKRAAAELAKAKHTESIELKKRISKIMPDYDNYRHDLQQRREDEYERRLKEANEAFEREKEELRLEHRAARDAEKERRRAAEAKQRAEEEELAREREEREREDIERKAKAADQKKRQEEERRKLDEQAQKQREREDAAEAKLRLKKQQAREAPLATNTGVYRPGQGKYSSQRISSGYGEDKDASSLGVPRESRPANATDGAATNAIPFTPGQSTTASAAPNARETESDRPEPGTARAKYIPPQRNNGGAWKRKE